VENVRVRGRENGSYPYNYLEMIDRLFGNQDDTIEVCSGMVRKYDNKSCFTVDMLTQRLISTWSMTDKFYLLYRMPNLIGGDVIHHIMPIQENQICLEMSMG
jgi:hypothetical protein